MARIAILIPDMRGGGAERVALTLVQGFLNRGHQVDLIVLRAGGELMAMVPPGAHIVELDAVRMRSSVWPLATYLKQRQPEALLAVMWPLTVLALIAKFFARSKVRLAVSDHGILSEHYAGKPVTLALVRLTSRLLYPRADVRIVPSHGIANDLHRLSGLGQKDFQVIPNPVAHPQMPIETVDLVERLWGDAAVRILSVGALKAEKDHQLLIRAFAKFARNENARLLIVGEGPLRPQLEALARELGIDHLVVMPGFQSDPWPCYASASLFVLSSQSEGFGNVIVEALAAGLPIVSTDCGGPREILAEGKWGLLVPPNDEEALANAMKAAVECPADKDALTARASQFDPEQAVDSYLSRLLDGQERGTAC